MPISASTQNWWRGLDGEINGDILSCLTRPSPFMEAWAKSQHCNGCIRSLERSFFTYGWDGLGLCQISSRPITSTYNAARVEIPPSLPVCEGGEDKICPTCCGQWKSWRWKCTFPWSTVGLREACWPDFTWSLLRAARHQGFLRKYGDQHSRAVKLPNPHASYRQHWMPGSEITSKN